MANDADEKSGAGDPLDLALLEYANRRCVDLGLIRRERPRRSSLPFESSYKFMRATVEERGALVSYLKGAPEVILQRSRLSVEERGNWEEKADAYAREGFRVLAFGHREGEGDEEIEFLGLALLWDPPRPEVPDAIRLAQDAGIRVSASKEARAPATVPASTVSYSHPCSASLSVHRIIGSSSTIRIFSFAIKSPPIS